MFQAWTGWKRPTRRARLAISHHRNFRWCLIFLTAVERVTCRDQQRAPPCGRARTHQVADSLHRIVNMLAQIYSKISGFVRSMWLRFSWLFWLLTVNCLLSHRLHFQANYGDGIRIPRSYVISLSSNLEVNHFSQSDWHSGQQTDVNLNLTDIYHSYYIHLLFTINGRQHKINTK